MITTRLVAGEIMAWVMGGLGPYRRGMADPAHVDDRKAGAPGDLNADGKGDLLGVTSGGDLYRYLNTSPG
ncbi:hypothetical protein ABZ318_18855, partial [Streptomyces sp. NPDC006197]|uniref:hypothetical protein n=1 Tax=Streptomyces sp. NPDC006197 TaxID=3156685 RepID=UPI00339FF192